MQWMNVPRALHKCFQGLHISRTPFGTLVVPSSSSPLMDPVHLSLGRSPGARPCETVHRLAVTSLSDLSTTPLWLNSKSPTSSPEFARCTDGPFFSPERMACYVQLPTSSTPLVSAYVRWKLLRLYAASFFLPFAIPRSLHFHSHRVPNETLYNILSHLEYFSIHPSQCCERC